MDQNLNSSMDEEGNLILCLERKSVKPFKTQDEYLYAMKEDLAEWFHTLYPELSITEDNFFQELDTGVVLCRHANTVQNVIRDSHQADTPRSQDTSSHHHHHHHHQQQQQHPSPQHQPYGHKSSPFISPRNNPSASRPPLSRHSSTDSESDQPTVVFRQSAKPGSFQSRDNIANFLSWCRAPPVSIPDTLLFETEDLVGRRNQRNVVLCLLEVARRGAKYGVLAPTIIQMEVEIDLEIAAERDEDPGPLPPPPPPVKRKTVDMMSLDEMVRSILGECTCPDQFPMIRVSEGKYKIGDNETLIFVRILRRHVMVRIGGGWDTLENYLDRHDPCRCQVKGHNKGHKVQRGLSQKKRRVSAPAKTSGVTRDVGTHDRSKNCPSDHTANQCSSSTPLTKTRELTKPVHRASVAGCPTAKSTQSNMPGQTDKSLGRPSAIPNGRCSPSPYQMRSASPGPSGRSSPAPRQTRPASPGPSGRSSPAPRQMRPASPGPSGRSSPAPRQTRPASPGPSGRSSPAPRQMRPASPGPSGQNSQAPRQLRPSSPVPSGRSSPVNRQARPSSPSPMKAKWAEPTSRSRRESSSSVTVEERHASERPTSPKPGGARPVSARCRRTSEQVVTQDRGDVPDGDRGRARSKTRDAIPRRSSSVGAADIKRVSLNKTASTPLVRQDACDKDNRLAKSNSFMIKRDSSGRHRIENKDASAEPPARKMPPARIPLTPDKILSNMPKLRSQNSTEDQTKDKAMRTPKKEVISSSTKANAPLKATHSVPLSNTINLPLTSQDADVGATFTKGSNLVAMRQRSASSFSLNCDYEDYPEPPPEDQALNAHMELLFEEYKKIEKGVNEPKSDEKKTDAKLDKKQVTPSKGNTKAPVSRGRSGTQEQSRLTRSRSLTRESLLGKVVSKTVPKPSPAIKKEQTPPSTKRPSSPVPQRKTNLVKSNSAGNAPRSALSAVPPVKTEKETQPKTNSTPVRRTGLSMVTPTGNVTAQNQTRKTIARSASVGRMSFKAKPADKPVNNVKQVTIKRFESDENVSQTKGRQSRADALKKREAGPLKQILSTRASRLVQKPSGAGHQDNHSASASADTPDVISFVHESARETICEKSPKTIESKSVNPGGESRGTFTSKSDTSSLSNETSTLNGDFSSSGGHPSMNSLSRPRDLDLQSDCSSVSESQALLANPRKDDRFGPRTRIPMPVGMKQRLKAGLDGTPLPSNLKRFDSGVDITNLSPSETSVHGDDEPNWHQQRPLSPPPPEYSISDTHDLENDEEYY